MATIEEIATEAGVSIATVSRTLRSPNIMKTANQRRVLQAARKMGYEPGGRKTADRKTGTRQIVFLSFATVLSRDVFYHESTYMPIVNGLSRVLYPNGYDVQVVHEGLDFSLPPCLERQDIDGIIFHGRMEGDFWEKYVKPFPCVGIQHIDPALSCNWVKTDFTHVSYQAVAHLKALGHRKIGFVVDTVELPLSNEQVKGFVDAMTQLQLPFRPDWVFARQQTFNDGLIHMEYELPDLLPCMEKVFSSSDRPTALVCKDNWRASAAIHALNRMRVKVPDEVSVIGSCNEGSGEVLTCIDTRLSDVCAYAAQVLLDLIHGRKKDDAMTYLLRPKLIAGNSVKSINGEYPKL